MRESLSKRFEGADAIAELRKTINAFEMLGFGIEEIVISGSFNVRDSVLELGDTFVSTPVKAFEIAKDVFARPNSGSVVNVLATREADGSGPELFRGDEDVNVLTKKPGERIELDEEDVIVAEDPSSGLRVRASKDVSSYDSPRKKRWPSPGDAGFRRDDVVIEVDEDQPTDEEV